MDAWIRDELEGCAFSHRIKRRIHHMGGQVVEEHWPDWKALIAETAKED